MSSTWKSAVGILLIFALGCVSGALSTAIFYQRETLFLARDPQVAAQALENRLTRHLDLEADQDRQIHRILLDYLQNRHALLGQIQPQMQALNLQMIQDVRSVLKPDQVDRFHENVLEIKRRLAHTAFPGESPPPNLGAPAAPPAANP